MLLGPNTKPGILSIALTEGRFPWTGVNGAFEVVVDPVPRVPSDEAGAAFKG